MSHNKIPELPDEFLALADDIKLELLDVKHIKRVHGRRTCYTAGCRGPICLRADREFNRDRYAAKRKAEGKPYTPSDLRRDERDDEIEAAIVIANRNADIIEIVSRLTDLYQQLAKAV